MKRPQKLASASAYYRIARKFEKAGQDKQAAHYRNVADRLVEQNRRAVEYRAERAAHEAAWRAKMAAEQAAKQAES